MLSYQADIEAAGGTIAFHTPVMASRVEDGRIVLETGGREAAELKADLVVNAAGLEEASRKPHTTVETVKLVEGQPPAVAQIGRCIEGSYVGLSGPSNSGQLPMNSIHITVT